MGERAPKVVFGHGLEVKTVSNRLEAKDRNGYMLNGKDPFSPLFVTHFTTECVRV